MYRDLTNLKQRLSFFFTLTVQVPVNESSKDFFIVIFINLC